MAVRSSSSIASIISFHCEQASWFKLVSLYRHLRAQGYQPDTYTFPCLIKACPHLQDGRAIHADTIKRGFTSDPYVTAALLAMYPRHRAFQDALQLFEEIPDPNHVLWNVAISSLFHAGNCGAARELFDRMPSPNHVTWSAVVAGYSQNGLEKESLCVFVRMRRELLSPWMVSSNTIASVLSACVQCRDLSFGEQIHGYIVRISTLADDDVFVGTVLVDMYGKCGQMALARLAFESMVVKSVVAWTSLIANYLHDDNPLIAKEVFKEMIHSGVAPNNVTLTTMISACTSILNLLNGKELHCALIKRRPEGPDVFASTALIDMYGKCRLISYACRVFEKNGDILGCPTPMCNAMISGFAMNYLTGDAWSLIRSMGQSSSSGMCLNSVTLATILPMCAKSAFLLHGKELHGYAIKNRLEEEILLGNGLLDMYAKCGKINCAQIQFNKMKEKNRISWTTLIAGYGMNGDPHGAINVFKRMVTEENVKPDNITFVALISACSHSGLVEEGLQFFEIMIQEYGIIPTEENYGCLIDLLARAGHIDEARGIITKMPIKPTANVWGALLGACRIHGDVNEAEVAEQQILELEPRWRGSGFRALLSHIYAEMGRVDGAAKVERYVVEMGLERRQGCSWLETKESPSRFMVAPVSVPLSENLIKTRNHIDSG